MTHNCESISQTLDLVSQFWHTITIVLVVVVSICVFVAVFLSVMLLCREVNMLLFYDCCTHAITVIGEVNCCLWVFNVGLSPSVLMSLHDEDAIVYYHLVFLWLSCFYLLSGLLQPCTRLYFWSLKTLLSTLLVVGQSWLKCPACQWDLLVVWCVSAKLLCYAAVETQRFQSGPCFSVEGQREQYQWFYIFKSFQSRSACLSQWQWLLSAALKRSLRLW